MGFIEQLGSQAAAGIMGIALQGHNDRRQKEQQQDLQNMQIRGNKEMMDYSMLKQMEMWKNTNFSAQIAQMKAAGLSPGLIYGMKGGGGITTGSPQGNVAGATAPVGGQEIQTMIGQGMNLQLMEAQKQLIQAQAENVKADTANKPKTGEQIEATTLNLLQGVESQKAQQELTQVQTRINQIDEWIKNKSKEDAADLIMWQAQKTLSEVEQIFRNNTITKATQENIIEMVAVELTAKYIQNDLTQAQITTEKGKPALQTAQTQLSQEQAKKTATDIIQGYLALGINQQNANTQEAQQKTNAFVNDISEKTKLGVGTIKDVIRGIITRGK